jgi:hypothetical protein
MSSQLRNRRSTTLSRSTPNCSRAVGGARRSCQGRIEAALFGQLRMQQLMWWDLQRLSDQRDVVDGNVANALLQASDECSVEPAFKCQLLLGEVRSDARHPNIFRKDQTKAWRKGRLGRGGRHPTDGWKKMCLKPRCLNIIRGLSHIDAQSAARLGCRASCANKRYSNTSLMKAQPQPVRSACERAT